mmetsp:Transcript_89433/g.257950  ORF Transcript_89433/g.257950 Transcript_89433/m.257950 type:complete len:281 (+) Transcript_89433:634-1476(+)
MPSLLEPSSSLSTVWFSSWTSWSRPVVCAWTCAVNAFKISTFKSNNDCFGSCGRFERQSAATFRAAPANAFADALRDLAFLSTRGFKLPCHLTSDSYMRWCVPKGSSKAPSNAFNDAGWQTTTSLWGITSISGQPRLSPPCCSTMHVPSEQAASKARPSLLQSTINVTKLSPHHCAFPTASRYILLTSTGSRLADMLGKHANVMTTTVLRNRRYKSAVGECTEECTIRPGLRPATHLAKSCNGTVVPHRRWSLDHSAFAGSKSGVPCAVGDTHGAAKNGR